MTDRTVQILFYIYIFTFSVFINTSYIVVML